MYPLINTGLKVMNLPYERPLQCGSLLHEKPVTFTPHLRADSFPFQSQVQEPLINSLHMQQGKTSPPHKTKTFLKHSVLTLPLSTAVPLTSMHFGLHIYEWEK